MFELAPRELPIEPDTPYYAQRQYGTVVNVMERWAVYALAEDNLDFFGKLIENTPLHGDETIVDVGSLEGANMSRLRSETGHAGCIINLDIEMPWYLRPNETQVVQANGQKLPFADNSVDALFSLFSLYHFEDPKEGLREFQRVVRPDGLVVVATSGRCNKLLHRIFEVQMAEEMEALLRSYGHDDTILPPRRFSRDFNGERAERWLPQFFDVDRDLSHTQQCPMLIHDCDEEKAMYANSLLSMKDNFTRVLPDGTTPPTPDHVKNLDYPYINYSLLWQPAYQKVVQDVMDATIAEKGEFADYIDRRFYVCRNTRKESGQ